MHMTKPRLFITGDSFAVLPRDPDPVKNWILLLAEKLSDQLGQQVEVINNSLMGCAQDWNWMSLQNWYEYTVTDNDFVVVAMTHPSRQWFFENQPEIANANLIDLDKWVSKEQARTVELFIKYMQRPNLDLIAVQNRLAYLAYMTRFKSLRKPVIIKCFTQIFGSADSWPDLNLAQGDLMNIQRYEFENIDIDDRADFWRGLDCRYNHLCLSNHEILASKIFDTLINDQPLDLTQGFIQGLIKDNALQDLDFVRREFDYPTYLKNQEKLKHSIKHILPWKARVNIDTGQK
jgi:hypothetical protein